MVIALTGLPRVGKDTFSDTLINVTESVIKYSFSSPFKRALCEMFVWSLEDFEDDSKELVDPYWGISKRQAMEYLGSEVCRNHMRYKFPLFDALIQDNIWVKRFELFYEANKDKDIILTDLRYAPEYKFLKTVEHKIVQIDRPNYSKLDFSKWYDIPSMHYDYKIKNEIEGNIKSYQNKVIELYNTIMEGK